jgi:hypothetical protein
MPSVLRRTFVTKIETAKFDKKKQLNYDVALRPVRATIVAVEKQ